MNNKAYLFAAALVAGTMGMTSCSNEIVPEAEINPTFDGESVKTQFAINIPAAKSTRMTAENTQQNSKPFLGMQNIKLLPLKETPADNKGLLQIISLENIANNGLDNNRKFYSDVNIPVGTSNFLFYAEATGSTNAAEMKTTDNAFEHGVLSNTLNDAVTNNTNLISFSLVPITSKNNFSDATDEEKDGSAAAIIEALTGVAGATDWRTYATNSTNVNATLTKLYNDLTSLNAGSANSVKLVLQDLQNELKKIDVTDVTVKGIVSAIQTQLDTYIGTDGTSGSLATNTFPQDYNLPDGAVRLSWKEGVPTYDGGGYVMGDMTLKPENICYPASLSYFVNTPLKATSDVDPIWPTDLSNWTGNWTVTGGSWTNGPVTAATTAIGLTKAIQYAVANLKTTVKCKTAVLEDNAAHYGEPTNRKVIVPTNGFTVTGVLVGGQPSSVAWDFVPSSDEADQRAMMVYDKNMNETVAATATNATGENYTLVLDNRKTGEGNTTLDKADKVYVAIELKNTSGADFYGADGLVKDGATFYLVAELNPNAGTDAGVTANSRTSVFEQDYTTVANLTISSLKNAYNCIPDLRSTQLSLGLAVDLSWQSGITFDVTID